MIPFFSLFVTHQLLGFLVHGVLATEFAILHEFQSVRVIFLVFLCVVISLLALGACQSNLDSCVIRHLAAPPIIFYLTFLGRNARVPPSERNRTTHDGWRIARFLHAKMRTTKKPFDRGRDIIPHFGHAVKSFFKLFPSLFQLLYFSLL